MIPIFTSLTLRTARAALKPVLAVVTACLGFQTASAIDWYTPKDEYSIARNWSERALEGIRMDTPHPPGQARNLFSFSVCMYDAWAAFDPKAVGFVYREKHTATDIAKARREAISYAVFRMMLERHAYSRTA